MTFDCHWKGMESWVGAKVFYSDYNVATVYLNLQMRSLVCREHGTLQTGYSLWSTVRLLYYNLTAPIERAPPICHPGT